MAGMKRVHVLWWGIASVVVMVIGSFGPWAKILGFVTVNGTDDGHDGWVVIVSAAVGAVALLLFWAKARWWLIFAELAAGVGLATTIYDRVDLGGTSGGFDFGQIADPGWGIYVAMFGSASLAVAGVAGWIVSGKAAETTAPA